MTAFGDGSQILSTWPAGVIYNPNEDKYTYSIKTTWLVQPLDHFHVVDIDLTASPPYTLTLQLPILFALPLSSRIYFFYVSRANTGDFLSFIPTSGSGNTVNGNAVSSTFTLSGGRELFMCIGTNSNSYVIHRVGGGSSFSPYSTIPTVRANYDLAVLPLTSSVAFPMNASPYTAKAVYADLNAVTSMQVLINGMSGYIVPNVLIPTTTAYGYRCTKDGNYLHEYALIASASFVAGVSGTNYGALQCCLAEFNAAGTKTADITVFNGAMPFKAVANPGTSTCNWRFTTSRLVPMSNGYYYLPYFLYDNSSTVTAFTGLLNGSISFSYWCPFSPVPPGPTLLSAPQQIAEEEQFISPLHAPALVSDVVAAQKKAAIASASAASAASSAASFALYQQQQQQAASQQFSLQDIEKIVSQALSSQLAAVSSSSSHAAPPPSNPPPPQKKRKAAGGRPDDPSGEKEIL